MTAQTARDQSYWAEFPETYRAEQIAIIAKWLLVGDSGVVVGGSGTGKSNLVGFIASRPAVICQHLPGQLEDYCFLHLDINSLPTITTSTFYRGLLYALQSVMAELGPELDRQMTQITSHITNWEDALALYFALQQGHELLINRAGKKVVWLIDRFDAACRRLEAGTLSSLRNLRDYNRFRGKLSYLVFTRFPLARLRDPAEFDEFHEIMVANTCWVGPMVARDAHWIARQMAERHQTTFDEQDVAQLIEVSGGLPAFMKAACTSLATGPLGSGEPIHVWTEQLLAQPIFQRNCQEIWADCLSAEQTVLASVASWGDERGLDRNIISYLEKVGLLVRHPPHNKIRVFSPIFAAFVKQQQNSVVGALSLDPKTGVVLCDGMPAACELTLLEHRLLGYFVAHADSICEKEALIAYVWPDEKLVQGVRDDSLAQLVRRLRDKLKTCSPHHEYIQTVHGRGYRLVQPEA